MTVEYIDRNLTLSLDNDDLDQVDACEFARNKATSSSSSVSLASECFRVNAFYTLPQKCENQIETCFRYFDLNGPLILGRSLAKSNSLYEGCMSDLYLNEQMINLEEDALLDYKTQVGCQPKETRACQESKCSTCKHIWSEKFKCNDKNESESETFSLANDGYLLMENSQRYLKKSYSIRDQTFQKVLTTDQQI